MVTEHTVKQGECLSSIAHRYGHFWETLWDDPGNAELRELRKDPNVLRAGDQVVIPPLRAKSEEGAAESRHRFRRKGVPAMLRLRVMMEEVDDSEADEEAASGGSPSTSPPPAEPRAHQEFVLDVDGTLIRGTTDADGQLEVPIPPDARHGRLTIGPDNTVIDLTLGGLDPIDEITGVQGRLNNLGFHCGSPDGVLHAATRAALKHFQEQHGLDPTGEPDAQTRDKIEQVHGS